MTGTAWLSRRVPALLAALLGASCATEAPPPEPTARSRSPIVDGQVDPSHPATVALTTNGQAFCSGTLVTKTVVVTASHCIYPGIGIDPPTAIEVFFGTDVNQGGTFIPVVEGKYNPVWNINLPDSNEDVAVLRLASPAPVAPLPMAKVPVPGTLVTLVGFGITSAGGSGAGTKRVTQVAIDAWQAKTFSMTLNPSGTCNGDSGGTALYDDGSGDKFVGIHTRSDCQTFMLDERVDAHQKDFIQPFIDAGATCAADLGCAQGCASPDPDCPCAKDGFCTASCTTPALDPDCDKHCAADGVCATDCPNPDPDCPVCVADGVCVAACAADPDCVAPETGGAGGTMATAGPSTGAGARPISTTTTTCSIGAPSERDPANHPWPSMGGALALGIVARVRRRLSPVSRRFADRR